MNWGKPIGYVDATRKRLKLCSKWWNLFALIIIQPLHATDGKFCSSVNAVVLQLAPTDVYAVIISFFRRTTTCYGAQNVIIPVSIERKSLMKWVVNNVCLIIIYLFLCNFVFGVWQVFWYIPLLKDQLGKLLQNDQRRHLLLHETRPERNSDYVSDVYDTPRWLKVAGPSTEHLSRIVFQICVDAFPWTSRKNAVMLFALFCNH